MPHAIPVLRPTRFCLDGIDEQPPSLFEGEMLTYLVVDGFTNDSRWNGWACPYFTKAQADIVAATIAAVVVEDEEMIERVKYDETRDAYIITSACYPGEEQVITPVEVNGVKYYCIGAWSWTWDQER